MMLSQKLKLFLESNIAMCLQLVVSKDVAAHLDVFFKYRLEGLVSELRKNQGKDQHFVYAWKVFLVRYLCSTTHSELYPVFWDLPGLEPFKEDDWNEDAHESNPGFHCFVEREDAEDYAVDEDMNLIALRVKLPIEAIKSIGFEGHRLAFTCSKFYLISGDE